MDCLGQQLVDLPVIRIDQYDVFIFPGIITPPVNELRITDIPQKIKRNVAAIRKLHGFLLDLTVSAERKEHRGPMPVLVDRFNIDDTEKLTLLHGCLHHPWLPVCLLKGLLKGFIRKQLLDPRSKDRLCNTEQLPECLIDKQNTPIKIRIGQCCIMCIQNPLQLIILGFYDPGVLAVHDLRCDQLCHAVHKGDCGPDFFKQGLTTVLRQD